MRRYGLIGQTLKHSFSQAWFTKKFEAEGITDCRYENFELPSADALATLLQTNPGIQGLNVTIPYKEDVLPFLTTKSPVVEKTGACNCIKIKGDSLIGYNTDVVGFTEALQPLLKPHHTRALILGTGGASKAVAYALEQLEIQYRFVSRKAGASNIGYKDLTKSSMEEHPLIINTTPLGTWPNVHEKPSLPYQFITPSHLLFDLVYNPAVTAFLAEGLKQGAQTSNGEKMLIGQAEESWRIWNEG